MSLSVPVGRPRGLSAQSPFSCLFVLQGWMEEEEKLTKGIIPKMGGKKPGPK